MSRYGFFEVFQEDPFTGITRVDYIFVVQAGHHLPLSGPVKQTTDDIVSYFFLENRIWYFMQIVTNGDK